MTRTFTHSVFPLSLLVSVLAASAGAQTPERALVSGVVRDSASGRPIRIASVRSASENVSTITDDEGRFHLLLPLGTQRLDVRRIGFTPTTATVAVREGGTQIDVRLSQFVVSLDRVLVTAHDDFAERLIRAAIVRKNQMRSTLHDASYHGDVRLVVRNLDKPADSAASVAMIAESQTEAYWETPDRYMETIVARRETANLPPQNTLIGVGNLLDFNAERVDFGQFLLPSLVADDALSHYAYEVLDTIQVGGRRTYRLSAQPKPLGEPAFVGVIDIADSTFDVVGIDVGLDKDVNLSIVKDFRYRQHFAQLTAGRWMPDTVEFTLSIDARPIAQFGIRDVASLSNYKFNNGNRPAGLGEYAIMAAPGSEHADSTTWAGFRIPPLAPVESLGWKRIDSLHAPHGGPVEHAIGGAFGSLLTPDSDGVHFNRVDGFTLGGGATLINADGWSRQAPTAKLGYSFAAKRWQYRVGDAYHLSLANRTWIGASYSDQTSRWPTLLPEGAPSALVSLLGAADPNNYFRARTLSANARTRVAQFTDLSVTATAANQSSLTTVVTRAPVSWLGTGAAVSRPNLSIDDGNLRTVSGTLAVDSRPLARVGDRDIRLAQSNYARVSFGGEFGTVSSAQYQRVEAHFTGAHELFGIGHTTFAAAAGLGSSQLPLQRSFSVDNAAQVLETQQSNFITLGDSSFTGSRTAVVTVSHDFDRALFARSGLPLVRDLPFTVVVEAGAFWAEMPTTGLSPALVARRSVVATTRDPYREVGFTIGNLTPFLRFVDLSAHLGWQLSAYHTSRFAVVLGL